MLLSDMPIRRKLTLIILVTCITSLLLMSATFFVYEYVTFRRATVRQLSTIGDITAANSTAALAFENQSDATEILAALAAERHIVAACLYDRTGRLFSKYPDSLPDGAFPARPGPDGYHFEHANLEGFQPASQGGNGRVGTLYLRFDTGTIMAEWIRFSVEIGAGVMAVVVLAAYLMSRALQRQISGPVLALSETARAVSERRDYSVRATKLGGDELGRLTDAFNQMLERIEKQNTAITEREAQLQTVLENLEEGVVVSDLDGHIIHFNRAALGLYGFGTLAESQRHLDKFGEIFELSAVDGAVLPAAEWPLARVIRGDSLRDLEIRVRHVEQGWVRILSYSGTLVKNPAGKPIMAILAIDDITERKGAEAKINQLNAQLELRVTQRTAQLEAANRELEAFSYSVSHDLRAPLRHIDGFAGLLAKGSAKVLDDTGRRHVATISAAAKRLGRLIDDLLAFSRTGRTELRYTLVDQDALLATIIREGGFERSGRAIEWRLEPLPKVEADASMLRQVWANLIENAVKYSGKNEHPRVEVGAAPDSSVGEYVFHVRDNGVGFDMKYVEKLFGVFQRLHSISEFEGTGIGLANVRRIVMRHGGRTWAEGSIGQGATFYFSMPIPKGASR